VNAPFAPRFQVGRPWRRVTEQQRSANSRLPLEDLRPIPLPMSTATAHLLEEFDRLPRKEQLEFSAVIVHRAAQLDYGDITDEELTASAGRIFAMLDEEEHAQAR